MRREDINYFAQHAKDEDLKKLYEKICKNTEVRLLSNPTEQTLLVPVKDPISGGNFYGGEVLVTSCIIKIGLHKGWAMVMDIDEKKALHVATLDGAWEADILKDDIKKLVKNVKEKLDKKTKKLNQKVNSTRVSFDLM